MRDAIFSYILLNCMINIRASQSGSDKATVRGEGLLCVCSYVVKNITHGCTHTVNINVYNNRRRQKVLYIEWVRI